MSGKRSKEPSEKRRPKLGHVCTSISAKTPGEMAEKATAAFALGTDLVEFRIDLLEDPSSIRGEDISRFARRSIITVRRRDEGGGFRGPESERMRLISEMSQLKPVYVDIELSTAKENPKWFMEEVSKRTKTIVSWHDFGGTPSTRVLQETREEAGALGDVAKIVTMARKRQDNLRVLKLYEEDGPLIAFCMGEAGKASRLAAMRLGSPVTYASLPNEGVAPGQIPLATIIRLKKAWEAAGRVVR